jgi:hypothetical protein
MLLAYRVGTSIQGDGVVVTSGEHVAGSVPGFAIREGPLAVWGSPCRPMHRVQDGDVVQVSGEALKHYLHGHGCG